MPNIFHDTYIGHNVHAITANPDDGSYADVAARDADTAFQIDSNINKVVRVESPLSFYILSSIGPVVWISLGTLILDTLIGLVDTPGSYSGQAGNVIQVDTSETGIEFGQKLRTTDSPTFAEVTANGIIVGIAIPLNTTHRQIVTGNPHSVLASELSDYNSVWDTRLGTKDTDNLSEGITNLYYTDARVNVNINVSANTTHRSSDGSDHTFIDQSVTINSNPTFNNLILTGKFHTQVASAGVSASSVADGLVIEDSTNTGISILTPDANDGRVVFGSPSDPFGAFMTWSFSVSDFAVGTSKIGANFRLTSDLETTNLTLSGGVGSELATFAKDVTVSGSITTPQLNADNLRLDLNTISNTDGVGGINIITGQGILILADGINVQGTSPAATGTGSQYIRFRDNRTTVTSAPNYVLAISRQNSALISLWLGNDGNGDAIIVTGDNDLRIGNDVTGTFTENVRFAASGNVKLEINGQIKITGGNPGNSKYLRSDADGLATWGEVGWTRLGTNVVLLNGNDSVGMGAIPDASAKLDVASTTKGFLPPRMTTTQIDAIASPAIGLESYDTTINKKKVFTGAEFKTFLTEDAATVLVQETFASTNVRFFGELALPATQGWTDTPTGIATIDLVTQTVFGEVKQVVRHNDDTGGGATTSKITLTAQNWIDINAFGASYGGTARLDTVNGGSGFFSGLQANSAQNPLATGNRRYGIFFNNNAGNLQLGFPDVGGGDVTLDGTGGNPLITFDEWFSWECVVPAGLGVAEFYINGILTTFAPAFNTNIGGLGTTIQVGSGSTAGSNRIVYHDNFGVTIYEEAATKTLLAATMAGDVAQINIPEGKRDYTIILPDGNPRPIGSVLRLVASNLGGSVSLQNENPAVPEVLYNGLRTLLINVAVKEIIEGINTVNSGNVYLGFQTTDFKIIGSIVVGGNTTATVILTINTFVDLNLGGNVLEEGNIEGFTLTNTTTGEIRYDGNKPVSLILNGLVAAISAGGSQRFNFRLLKNGSPLPFPDNVDIPIEIGGRLDATVIHWPVIAVTGDLFRLQVENADGVSDITIDTLKFAMV